MKLQYFKEIESGDYGVVDLDEQIAMYFEGRTTSVEHDINSVSTSMIGSEFLAYATKLIDVKKVPKRWLKALKDE